MSATGSEHTAPHAYLDHAASSPMRPEAMAASVDVQSRVFANPSGSHRWAREARRNLDDSRDVVAALVGADPSEVVFTSGGTEAANAAVRGVVAATGGTAVCSGVEHHAVLDTVRALEGLVAPVDSEGRVDLEALQILLEAEHRSGRSVALVSVMLANNETGVVNDLAGVSEVVRAAAPGAVLHTDAVAAAAWLDLTVAAAPADLVSLSGHKVGGPKGVGALVVRSGTPLVALITGGGQERERRSGTPDVAGAVAYAAAFAACGAERGVLVERVTRQRQRLLSGLQVAIPGLIETAASAVTAGSGANVDRTAGTLHVCVPGVDREALLFLLDEAGVAASWGSSCASGASEPSHVLAAMGVDPHLAGGSLRLSLGWNTTDAEIAHAICAVPAAVDRLRDVA